MTTYTRKVENGGTFAPEHTRDVAVTPDQAAAATAYVRRRATDADLLLTALGLLGHTP